MTIDSGYPSHSEKGFNVPTGRISLTFKGIDADRFGVLWKQDFEAYVLFVS